MAPKVHRDHPVAALNQHTDLPIPHLPTQTPAVDEQHTRPVTDVVERDPDAVPRQDMEVVHPSRPPPTKVATSSTL